MGSDVNATEVLSRPLSTKLQEIGKRQGAVTASLGELSDRVSALADDLHGPGEQPEAGEADTPVGPGRFGALGESLEQLDRAVCRLEAQIARLGA